MYITMIISISLCVIQSVYATLSDYEKQLLCRIPGYALVAPDVEKVVSDLTPYEHQERIVNDEISNPLFRQYPGLLRTLSYISLGDLPTPIHYCKNLSAKYPSTAVYIKNDGLTGEKQADGSRAFGGNKLRKLQYLLADAIAHGHTAVVTFGCAGSNHVLQTAVCAKQLGLDCFSMLTPQLNSHIVRKNLLLQKAYGAQICCSDNGKDRAAATISLCLACKKEQQSFPYIIPVGGSIARGAIGYVEAAFELKEQIAAGNVPNPDHIYVTLGSAGTAAGLLLGCKAAGIQATFHLIIVESTDVSRAWQKVHTLFRATNDLLKSLDETFLQCELVQEEVVIENQYSGGSYGLFTPQGTQAIKTIQELEGITLDGVYTAKTMSALLADLENKQLKDSNVLFWNTFCSQNPAHITEHIDYHDLPAAAHRYFETDVQSLDQ